MFIHHHHDDDDDDDDTPFIQLHMMYISMYATPSLRMYTITHTCTRCVIILTSHPHNGGYHYTGGDCGCICAL